MARHATTSPDLAEADRRATHARASLRARLETLEQKLGGVRDRIDLPEQIRRHPWPAVGVAFALGALAASRTRRTVAGAVAGASPGAQVERTLGATALAALGALALRLARDVALGQVSDVVRRWWTGEPAAFDESGQLDPAQAADPFYAP